MNIPEMLERKRKELPADADYIEELERLVFVLDEACDNLEADLRKQETS